MTNSVGTRRTLRQGRYVLQARIGQGGGGTVFRARDLHTAQTVAIKVLTCAEGGEREALAREAHLLARLQHTGLPSVSDYFTDGDHAFMVMTFVPGQDLAQQLSHRATPFPTQRVLGWAADVLDCLAYLHAGQPPIVHGDVKPRNLKLDASGRAVLLDFGLARHAGADPGLAGYTRRYASLEQLRGELTDVRSDLFALGASLYELLTRKAPVDALERAAAIDAGGADPLVPLRMHALAVPESVTEVIGRALALLPGERPASARVMKVALDEAANGPVTVIVTRPQPAVPASTPAPPVGVVTFLATAITARDVSPPDLARHDESLRRMVEHYGGRVMRTTPTETG